MYDKLYNISFFKSTEKIGKEDDVTDISVSKISNHHCAIIMYQQ